MARDPSFPPALKDLVDSGIGVAAAPTGGMGVALDAKGQLPFSTLPLSPAQLLCSADLTLTTGSQDVAGCSTTLGPGTYIVWGSFYMNHTVNGGGTIIGQLSVGGTIQAQSAQLFNTGSANGDAATTTQVWVFTIGDSAVVKFVANKTINAGTAKILQTNTVLTYMRVA